MHSHDRTLIARLGFDDPDKRNPLHDLACQYLSRPETAQVVIGKALEKARKPCLEGKPFQGTHLINEFPLQKGQGQYATTVGFIDVIYRFFRWTTWDDGTPRRISGTVAIEVKAASVPITDIIRQINFYRQFSLGSADEDYWVICVAFDLTNSEIAILENAGIHAFRLGPRFDAWVAEQTGPQLDQSRDLTV